MDKIILTDCDGCLLSWDHGFSKFMNSRGLKEVPGYETEYSISLRYNIPSTAAYDLVSEFNQGPDIEFLEPFADSIEYVTRLHREGFKFIVITSLSDHPMAKTRRWKNLRNVFGDIFEDLHCLKIGESKAFILRNWADTGYLWVEDHMRQAEAGYESNLSPVLINHPHNSHIQTDLFPRVSFDTPWKEIYGIAKEKYQ
jgi:hypothetical protein